jgi:hypothetical protein
MTQGLLITRGPSKLDLMLNLFDHSPSGSWRLPLSFKCSKWLTFSFRRIERVDGKSEDFIIRGVIVDGPNLGRQFSATYSTLDRKGTLVFE